MGAKTGLYAIPVLTPDRLEKRQEGRRFKEPEEPMFTLTSQDRHGVLVSQRTGIMEKPSYRAGVRIRRLTPLECFRLQGFPDEHFHNAKAAGISDRQLYIQAGNAVTVNGVYEIAKKFQND